MLRVINHEVYAVLGGYRNEGTYDYICGPHWFPVIIVLVIPDPI